MSSDPDNASSQAPLDLHSLLAKKLQGYDTVSEAEIRITEQAIGGTRTYKAGQDLVRFGDRLTYSTLLIDGWAARYKTMEGGARQITALQVPGDFVDLHSFMLHKMDHGVTALSDCRIATMPHSNLRVISETEPHLTRLLWLSTLVDAAIHRNWIVTMGRLPAVNHLANLICELYLRLEAVDLAKDFEFKSPLRQSDVADTLGLTTVHVNRIMQDIRGRHLLTWRGRTVKILDWDALVAFAQFDPVYLSLMKEPR